ncbi:hypothetical protein FRC10_004787 [Ceratobasidium sp. 414]|nr:hypothetical protein FRC10_004787 [Ceratobasidium sp. 414]
MFNIGSPKISANSGSAKSSAGMTIIYQLLAPRPIPPTTKPQTAYIKRKNPVQQKMTGAARIVAEERFVKGLGYIRADAIPCRSKAAKQASAGSVADLEWVCAATMSHGVAYGQAELVESAGSSRPGLYETPRVPSTFSL